MGMPMSYGCDGSVRLSSFPSFPFPFPFSFLSSPQWKITVALNVVSSMLDAVLLTWKKMLDVTANSRGSHVEEYPMLQVLVALMDVGSVSSSSSRRRGRRVVVVGSRVVGRR